MTISRSGCHSFLIVVLFLSYQSAVLTVAASETLDGSTDVATPFDSSEGPTVDRGSDEDRGNDPTSPEGVIPARQSRRSSFRADLGKRYPADWMRMDGKRASKMSYFRSDLGKRKWYVEPAAELNQNFKADGEQVVETKYGTEPRNGSVRRKRLVVNTLSGQVGRGGSRSWNDVEKRLRSSSFRADLGKRTEGEYGYGIFEYGTDDENGEGQIKESTAYPKRARYAFRGDLGKRSPLAEDEKRRNAFRGDLGRKRSLTLGRWDTMPSSSFDVGEPIQKLLDSTEGRGSDREYDGGLEKRRFRADLG